MNPTFSDLVGSVVTNITDRLTDADKTPQYRATKKLKRKQKLKDAAGAVVIGSSVITLGVLGTFGAVKLKEEIDLVSNPTV